MYMSEKFLMQLREDLKNSFVLLEYKDEDADYPGLGPLITCQALAFTASLEERGKEQFIIFSCYDPQDTGKRMTEVEIPLEQVKELIVCGWDFMGEVGVDELAALIEQGLRLDPQAVWKRLHPGLVRFERCYS